MKRCEDHLCYEEDTFIRNIVLLTKTERDIYLKKRCWTRNLAAKPASRWQY